ncbi:MAG: shikimate kinase [Candidatus Aenigmatarchaeota archaeon]
MNIYLVGFMGVGKTTVGKILAEKLNKEFIETDELIEKKENKTIVEIFAQKGEPYFRKLEKEILQEIAKRDNLVVSCGGGLICNEENLKTLKETGLVFNLTASSKTIYDRTKNYKNRPLLNVDNPLRQIETLLEKRKPYYDKAHYSINTEGISPHQVVELILEKIKDGKKKFYTT